MKKDTVKTFAKLGYTHLDTAEIVTHLNRILSSYEVYRQKLRNFHWNVWGHDFFELHDQFEKMYKRASEETDEIAERIRLFGQNPVSTFVEFLKLSSIREDVSKKTSFEMVKIIVDDIRMLLENMEEGVQSAKEIKDNGTEYMLQSFIYHLEKEHWMFNTWLKQKL